jgi:hypothetical protein
MDYETGRIIHLELCDKKETKNNSSQLEMHLVRRGLDTVINTHMCLVWEVITNASRGLIKLFSMYRICTFKHNQKTCIHTFTNTLLIPYLCLPRPIFSIMSANKIKT